jgi:2,3,4,5-tetrahydropyridine-2-carboxylate N-succinyltransferase
VSENGKAFGYGVATIAADGSTLDTAFHSLGLGPLNTAAAVELSSFEGADNDRNISRKAVAIEIELDKAPASVPDAYLRLHLLSHRLVKPHGFDNVRRQLQKKYGFVAIYGVDKFPRMVDYVIPDGVRIADADRVRLGAHLSAGTTVMHEGFVNFNAGTLGASMVEGRISAGVVVGDGSDIGGGASIMGTLSGGGKEVISIGKKTLLGANSGLGISLGDDCVVEAGVYITAGSKIKLPDGTIVKARELSGANGMLFRRNSQTGALEALPKSGSWGGLNSVLHAN